MFENNCYFPTAGFEKPNPNIDFDALGLKVEMSTDPLPDDVADPLISVNSFGYGGANGHVVLSRPSTYPFVPKVMLFLSISHPSDL